MGSNDNYPVFGGPSKWDVAVALFTWKPARHQVTFHANCPVGKEIEVSILSVQAEDGSGESWNIEGQVSKMIPNTGFVLGKHVFIYYRTDRRQGHIRLQK